VEAQDSSSTYVNGGVAITALVPQAWLATQTITFAFTYEAN